MRGNVLPNIVFRRAPTSPFSLPQFASVVQFLFDDATQSTFTTSSFKLSGVFGSATITGNFALGGGAITGALSTTPTAALPVWQSSSRPWSTNRSSGRTTSSWSDRTYEGA
jgi:hypothetical protein